MAQTEAQRLVENAAGALGRLDDGWHGDAAIRALAPVKVLLDTKGDQRREVLLLVADRASGRNQPHAIDRLLSMLARRKVELAFADALFLVECIDRAVAGGDVAGRVGEPLIAQLEASSKSWTPDEVATIRPLLERIEAGVTYEPVIGMRLGGIAKPVDGLPLDLLGHNGLMRDALTALLEGLAETEDAVEALLTHAAALSAGGKPTKAWLVRARTVSAKLADPGGMFRSTVAALRAYAALPDGPGVETPWVTKEGEIVIGGLLWTGVTAAQPSDLPALRSLAHAYIVPSAGSYGPRSIRLANTATVLIAEVGGPAALTELLALERVTRHGSLLVTIRKTIDALAAAQGLTRDELLERGVEDHGLGADGHRTFALSAGVARIGVQGNAAVLEYVDEAGGVKRSVPAAVKAQSPEALAAAKEVVKNLRKTIAAERVRLDALLGTSRRWALDDWRRYYVAHPVTGALVRRVVWRFVGPGGEEVVGVPIGPAAVRTAAGEERAISAEAEVRLWHPIDAAPAEVAAWRRRFVADEIVQPVKQAFRETYALTPAESETRVYSNRFAGHVFRQTQARALLKGRGWKPVPVSWWDDGIDHGVATRADEATGITAEFFFDPIREGDDFADNLYTYCTSDQVRFRRTGAAADAGDLALDAIPAVLFTEIMRDVDLVIGVASIGADPEWLDRGQERRFVTYWNEVAFGPLTEAAKVRHEVLEGLLPRLAIADRCTLDARHLVVRGTLGTYRIHLGSGNVQMEPDDRYLCIVRAPRGAPGRLFLPFDDDPVLTLVLSKAFMLAADETIDDATILAQMRREPSEDPPG